MAITAFNRGSGADVLSGTSFTVTGLNGVTGNLAVGSTAILVIAMDNANAPTGVNLTTAVNSFITDSVGNKWYVRYNQTGGAANSGPEPAVLTSRLDVAFTISDSLVINLTVAATAKTWSLIEAVPSTGNTVLTNWINPVSGINFAAVVTTLTPSLGAMNPCQDDLLVGMAFGECPDVWVADTVNVADGAWTNKQSAGYNGGTNAASMSVMTQWKISSGAAPEIFAPGCPSGTASDTRMGWCVFTESDLRVRGNGQNSSTETTTQATVGRVPQNSASMWVLVVAADNAATTPSPGAVGNISAATITDIKGNAWTRQVNVVNDPGAASAGVELAIYTSTLSTAPLVLGDTIPISFTVGVGSKCWTLWEFAPTGIGPMTFVTGGGGTAGVSGAVVPLVTGSIANGDYVVGLCGGEGQTTISTDFNGDTTNTTGSAWRQQVKGNKGLNASGMSITSQWKRVTASGTQTYNPTLIAGTADTMTAWVEINDASPAPPSGTPNFELF